MYLCEARVNVFKSIQDSGLVALDPEITAFVGLNESGKSAFLSALYKAMPVDSHVGYDVVTDYPRKSLTQYIQQHVNNPATVATLSYQLTPTEISEVNDALGYPLLTSLRFSVSHKYGNHRVVNLNIDERPFILHLLKTAELPVEIVRATIDSQELRELVDKLMALDLNHRATLFLAELKEKFSAPAPWRWLNYFVWQRFISVRLPQFLYFDEYKLLPARINLLNLQQRVAQSSQTTDILSEEDKTVLALFRLAQVDLQELTQPSGYENAQARLEDISNQLTDKIFEFWSQNQELEVQFDIKADPAAPPPFNQGNNLYIRVRHRRHRVSLPLDQRSRGLLWFFSFLVWFESLQVEERQRGLILLLDEPGLNLHALAQADCLRYLETLAHRYPVLYTTHSPFMLNMHTLDRVRFVEEQEHSSIVTANIEQVKAETSYPVHVALKLLEEFE